MIDILSKPSFMLEFSELLQNYTDDGLTEKEKILAHTPAHMLSEILLAFYCMLTANKHFIDKEHHVLSTVTEDDCIRVITLVESLGTELANKYGQDLHKAFVDELTSIEFDNVVIPQFILPAVIATMSYQLLIPSLMDSKDIINARNISVKSKKVK